MAPSVPLRGEIVLDRLRKSVNLLCNEQEKRPRRPLARLQRTARIAQIAKHEGVAEAITIATTAAEPFQGGSQKRVGAGQVTRDPGATEAGGGRAFAASPSAA